MARRIPAMLALALFAGLAWQPAAMAQAGRSKVDIDTRLQQAMADPKLADELYKVGRKVSAVCANCHGDGGNSTKPSVPNLAGQNPAYLLEQVRQFADGRRRYEFMEGMIRAMNSDEKIGMVLFYAAQPVTPKPVADAALLAKGQEIFGKNCFRCMATWAGATTRSHALPASRPTTCAALSSVTATAQIRAPIRS